MEIRKLTSDMAAEYLSYFDHVAFSDHEEWAACYCLESHLSQEENDALQEKTSRREKARELIDKGIMQGYLVYDGDAIVGWCNVGDKASYAPLMENSDYETLVPCKGIIKAIYCFEIAPGSRGKGITHLLMERIIRDAMEEGYSYVESYPFTDRNFEYQYHGPIPLYERYGFQVIAEKPWFYIMQKKLVSSDDANTL